MTILNSPATDYDVAETSPSWESQTDVSTINFIYSSGTANGVAQVEVPAGSCQPIVWTDFNLDVIPDDANISNVHVSIFSSESADPNLNLVGSTTWELRDAADEVLLTKTEPFLNGVNWGAGDDWTTLTTADFNFTDKGEAVPLKTDGTRFTKEDLLGSSLMWTVNNELEAPIDEYNHICSFVDEVKISITYEIVQDVIAGYMNRSGRPSGTGLTICNGYIMKLGPGTQDGLQFQWIMDPATQATAIAAIHTELAWAELNGLEAKLRIFNPPPAYLNATVPPVSHDGSGQLPIDNCAANQQFNPAGYAIPNVRYWHHPDYISAYTALQALLASEFDDNQYFSDVAFCGGILDFAEPMVRQIGNIDSKRAEINTWQAAGSLNGDWINSDIIALKSLMNAHTVWKHTPQSLACNPYQQVRLRTCGGLPRYAGSSSLDRTLELANYWCDLLGPLAVIGNNSIRPISPSPTVTYDLMYDSLVAIAEAKGATVYFQTANVSVLTSQIGLSYQGNVMETMDEVLDVTISRCGNYKAHYIELPGNYKDPGITLPPFPVS